MSAGRSAAGQAHRDLDGERCGARGLRRPRRGASSFGGDRSRAGCTSIPYVEVWVRAVSRAAASARETAWSCESETRHERAQRPGRALEQLPTVAELPRVFSGERAAARAVGLRAETAGVPDLCERAIVELGAVTHRFLDHKADLDEELR